MLWDRGVEGDEQLVPHVQAEEEPLQSQPLILKIGCWLVGSWLVCE